jgi:thioesterase domain-containing protein
LQRLELLDNELQLVDLQQSISELGLMRTDPGGQVLRRVLRVFAANYNAVYQPAHRFHGKLWVFVAEHARQGRSPEPTQFSHLWRQYAADVETLTVPGSHLTLLETPHVESLARKVVECWDQPRMPPG